MRYDAVEFLESLFRPGAVPRGVAAAPDPTPADLPGDWFVIWDERAAIMEFDAGLPRELAEHQALVDVLKQMRESGEVPR
jgi:hypothetical protein